MPVVKPGAVHQPGFLHGRGRKVPGAQGAQKQVAHFGPLGDEIEGVLALAHGPLADDLAGDQELRPVLIEKAARVAEHDYLAVDARVEPLSEPLRGAVEEHVHVLLPDVHFHGLDAVVVPPERDKVGFAEKGRDEVQSQNGQPLIHDRAHGEDGIQAAGKQRQRVVCFSFRHGRVIYVRSGPRATPLDRRSAAPQHAGRSTLFYRMYGCCPRKAYLVSKRVARLLPPVNPGGNHMARKAVDPEVLRKEALGTALTTIERKFGKGSIMRLDDEASHSIPAIPTGSIGLDIALGIGGVPRGRVIEIFGPESSGKTTLALHIIAQAQKAGGSAAFVDAEHALDPGYAKRLGVKTDELLISQPDYGEQALEIADLLVRSGALDVVVIDSVAALIPQSELEGQMGETQVGSQARLMSHALRKLTGTIHKSNCVVIFINQIRMKIGMTGYGNPETTSGGNALKFYASCRLDIRRIQTLKDKDEAYGIRARIKVVKNKVAPPFRQAEVDVLYGQGISRMGELIDMGVENGIIEKSGAWYGYGSEKLGQGKENVRALLTDNPDLAESIEEALMTHLGFREAPEETNGDTGDAGE
jgi:recombination protein RecA